jgi:hypothetical protein
LDFCRLLMGSERKTHFRKSEKKQEDMLFEERSASK